MLEKTLADSISTSGRYAGSLVYDALSDGQLLDWFVHQREEAAFTALVRRHGPMVLSVCRRVLRHSEDAEDAFQATFLVLAEKASGLHQPELLANWLYGVANRTAIHARQRASRRSEREREVATPSTGSSDEEIEARQLRQILDEELQSLPEKYRAPLVLCYLEGMTNEEAARALGWPSGSMSYRLARGRELLRERLESRLAGLSILLPAIWLAEHLQPVVVSPLLVTTTVQAVSTVVGAKMAAAAACLISASVRELRDASLRSLVPAGRRWLFTALLLVLTLSSIGAGVSIVAGSWLSGGASSPCVSSP
jgi:RNA polymerase sigma factor (sigma-70 family)